MAEEIHDQSHTEKLDRNGWKLIVTLFIFASLNLTVLLTAAGHLRYANAWAMVLFTLSMQMTGLATLAIKNPTLLNERGKGIKEDTKSFDRWFFKLYLPMAYIMMIVAGLDAGRFGWTSVPPPLTILGFVVTFFMYGWAFWAMLTNTHFEMTVRIQEDRDQKVITTGPYAYIRHPGYLTAVTVLMMCPLMLGGLWAYIPASLAALIMIARTALEDKTLHQELKGYPEYAQRVRFRLFPGIW